MERSTRSLVPQGRRGRPRVSLLFVLGALASGPLFAGTPTTAAYLELDPSARTAGLGSAGVAVVDDGSSLFLNPAGLDGAERRTLLASHSELALNDHLDALGYVQSFPRGAIGISALLLSRPSIDARDQNRNAAGSFTSNDEAFGLFYAATPTNGLRLGLGVKALHEQIASASASTFALDAGAQLRLGARGLTAGLALTNLGPGMKFVAERDPLPTRVSAGLGYAIGGLLISADAGTSVYTGRSSISAGLELAPLHALTVRGGYLMNLQAGSGGVDRSSRLSQFAGFGFGAGLRLGKYSVDFALSPNEELAPTEIFTLSSNF